MKRVLKIVLLSFLVVIAAFGLAIGGMYLFGGFEEKIIYADNISFNNSSVISSESFALKITTTTPDVTRNKLKLSVLPGGESVIDFPTQIEIGKIFTIKPKQIRERGELVNFGGNATLVASYDDDDANPSVVAKCEVLIDVPVKSLELKINSFTTTPNQNIAICNKDFKIDTVFGVNPARALMPYVEFGNQVITGMTDKALYLELVDEFGYSLDSKVAQFVVNDVAQQTNLIKVNYSYRDVTGDNNKEIVFDDNIVIASKTTQSKAILNAYVYSTYKEQSSNTVDGVLSLNKEVTQTKELGFTIGNYEIVDMNISATSEEVLLNEESKIYLTNSTDVGENDINLGLTLTTGSQGIEAGDYYLLNTCISITGNDYVQIKNLNKEDASFVKASENDNFTVKYEGISTEKSNWGWVLKIDSFNAYNQYVTTGDPIEVKIKYIEDGKTFERTFNIIPKIIEVDNFSVVYPSGKTSFDVESKKEQFRLKSSHTDNDMFNVSAVNGKQIPDNYSIEYYLSLTENYKNGQTTICTVPNKIGTYEVKFSFVLNHNTDDKVTSIVLAYCVFDYSGFKLSCNGKEIDLENYDLSKGDVVDVKLLVNIEDLNSIPSSGGLFKLETKAGETLLQTIIIEGWQTKFYEPIDINKYATVPYLTIDGVKYAVDFDYYQKGSNKYLKVNLADSTYNVEGIGEFCVTAQMVYVEKKGDTTQTFWLDNSANIYVTTYENLSEITATRVLYIDGAEKYDGKFEAKPKPIIEDSGYTDYIYITSSQIDALINYINAGQVKIYAEQVLDSGLKSSYSGIEEINKDTITFGNSFIAITDQNGNIVGFKIAYSIGKVNTICVQNVERENKFRIVIEVNAGVSGTVQADFLMSDKTKSKGLDLLVQDIVLNSAILTYNKNGSEEYGNANPLKLSATIDDGNVKYLASGTSFNPDILEYGLKYNIEAASLSDYLFNAENEDLIKAKIANTVQTLAYEFTVENSSGISLSGLFSFSMDDSCAGGIEFYNFPYIDGGVKLKLRVFSGTNTESNTYYSWDGNQFIPTRYDNLWAELYFQIEGLKIEFTPNTTNTFFGVKDEELNVFGEDGLFEVKVNNNPLNNVELKNIFTTYINKDYLFVKTSNNLEWLNDGSSLKFAKDLIGDEDVDFKFYVGLSTNDANAVKINGASFYIHTIKSPYEILVSNGVYDVGANAYKVNVSAPIESVELATYNIYDVNGEPLTGVELESAKAKIKAETITFELVDFDASCGVSNPVVKNANNSLTFKAVPLQSYKVSAKYILTIKTGQKLDEDGVTLKDIEEVREVNILITVSSSLQQADIQIGTKVEAVPNVSEEYYYIDAGFTKENPDPSGEPFVPNEYSITNDGIVLSGALAENIDNISNVSITFADNYDSNTPEQYRVFVDDHMKNTIWQNKNISLSSDDLKDEKTVIVTIVVDFINGGKYIYTKEIVVKPNISVTFSKAALAEGEEINLLELFYKDEEKLALSTNYDHDQTDNKLGYCKSSFVVDQNVFTDTTDVNGGSTYALFVNYGAAAACGGHTTIGFYYIVSNSYTLYFEFDVEIVAA